MTGFTWQLRRRKPYRPTFEEFCAAYDNPRRAAVLQVKLAGGISTTPITPTPASVDPVSMVRHELAT